MTDNDGWVQVTKRRNKTPKKCQISLAVSPYNQSKDEKSLLNNFKYVQIKNNVILDEINKNISGRDKFHIFPDNDRYLIKIISKNRSRIMLYQYKLHYERRIDGFIPVNVRKVIIYY